MGQSWPLSFAQQRLCFIESYEKGTNAYHVPWLMSFVRDINVEALKQSIEYIAERHKVLKTIFKRDDTGEICQIIGDTPLTIQTCRYASDSELTQYLREAVNKPFQLFGAYPIRIVLYQKNDIQTDKTPL